MDKLTKAHEQDIRWLTEFELLRAQAEPVVQKVTTIATSDPVSEEALLTALTEATKKLLQYSHSMRQIPKPRTKEIGEVRKDFLDGLALYIKGCESHINWFQTQKPRYLSQWEILMDDASRKFAVSTQRLRVIVEKNRVEQWFDMFRPLYGQAAMSIQKLMDAMQNALKKQHSEEVLLPTLRRTVATLPRVLESMKKIPPPNIHQVQDYYKDVVDALEDYIEAYRAQIQTIETQSQSQYELFLTRAKSAKSKSERANQRASYIMRWLHHTS